MLIITKEIEFDKLDAIYEEHFPGNPIVPGSLIVDSAVVQIRQEFPDVQVTEIANFKFRSFVKPGRYKLELHLKESFIKVILWDNKTKKVEGKVLINAT